MFSPDFFPADMPIIERVGLCAVLGVCLLMAFGVLFL